METLLGFMSDLILFTAGLVVAAAWLIIIVLVSVEIFDTITGNKSSLFPEPDDEDR